MATSGTRHGPKDPRSRSRSRWRRGAGWLPDLLVVALLAFALVAWHLDLGTRLGVARPDPRTDPAAVAAPEGLRLPALTTAKPVAAAQTDGQATAAKVSAAVSPLLTDPRLGPHVRVLVSDLTSGTTVFEHGTGPVTPASTMKLMTSVAGLASIGPATRFDTVVRRVPGTNRIVLVGGGDPFLASKRPAKNVYPRRADVGTLARLTAESLKQSGTGRVRLSYDDTLFSGPGLSPSWPASYAGSVAPPISALWVDEAKNASGFGYSADPSLLAARTFVAALAKQGVTVVNQPVRRAAPAGATEVAKVQSPPLGQIVARLLLVSDNNAAEVVAHQVGIKQGRGGSFAGGAAGVREVLAGLGVPLDEAVITDGSGLSRKDRLAPATLLAVLRVAASDDHPALRQAITGLPVAGFSGSLQYRFDTGAPAGRGRVQAKTGTLTGVHGLAGVATDLDGDVLGFVAILDRVAKPDQDHAQTQLDKIAAAIGACSCR